MFTQSIMEFGYIDLQRLFLKLYERVDDRIFQYLDLII
jgi:hypothetical protein